MMNQYERRLKGMKMRKTIIRVISVLVVIVVLVTAFGRESFRRYFKTLFSDFSGGLNRTVTVYDIDGNEIKSYTGKFDVDYNNDRIIFDDENGKRHMIFIKTGSITIDEN